VTVLSKKVENLKMNGERDDDRAGQLAVDNNAVVVKIDRGGD
jgi:hypothetical protein